MPGLQSWVNRWVGVNKNHVQFPDDDELSRHVNVRNISAQQQAANYDNGVVVPSLDNNAYNNFHSKHNSSSGTTVGLLHQQLQNVAISNISSNSSIANASSSNRSSRRGSRSSLRSTVTSLNLSSTSSGETIAGANKMMQSMGEPPVSIYQDPLVTHLLPEQHQGVGKGSSRLRRKSRQPKQSHMAVTEVRDNDGRPDNKFGEQHQQDIMNVSRKRGKNYNPQQQPQPQRQQSNPVSMKDNKTSIKNSKKKGLVRTRSQSDLLKEKFDESQQLSSSPPMNTGGIIQALTMNHSNQKNGISIQQLPLQQNLSDIHQYMQEDLKQELFNKNFTESTQNGFLSTTTVAADSKSSKQNVINITHRSDASSRNCLNHYHHPGVVTTGRYLNYASYSQSILIQNQIQRKTYQKDINATQTNNNNFNSTSTTPQQRNIHNYVRNKPIPTHDSNNATIPNILSSESASIVSDSTNNTAFSSQHKACLKSLAPCHFSTTNAEHNKDYNHTHGEGTKHQRQEGQLKESSQIMLSSPPCSQCQDLERRLLVMQSDVEYLRSLALDNEFGGNVNKSISSLTKIKGNKLPAVIRCTCCDQQKNHPSGSSVKSGTSNSVTSKHQRILKRQYPTKDISCPIHSEDCDKIRESAALMESSQRLIDNTTRHQAQIEQMTRERGRWQHDMHLKLSKFALLCKELNEEATLRKEDLTTLSTNLNEVQHERDAYATENETLKTKLNHSEEIQSQNALLRKALEGKDEEMFHRANNAIQKRDKIVLLLSERLQQTMDALEIAHTNIRQRRQIIFPGCNNNNIKSSSTCCSHAATAITSATTHCTSLGTTSSSTATAITPPILKIDSSSTLNVRESSLLSSHCSGGILSEKEEMLQNQVDSLRKQLQEAGLVSNC